MNATEKAIAYVITQWWLAGIRQMLEGKDTE